MSIDGQSKSRLDKIEGQNPSILAYYCIIHQSVLCASLGDEYKQCMDEIMKLVNYLRALSALQH